MPGGDTPAKVKSMLREIVGLSEGSLRQDDLALFSGQGGSDSVSLLRLVMAIEKEFGIVVSDGDIRPDNFESLASLIAFIERKVR